MEVYKRGIFQPRVFKSLLEARPRSFIACAWYLNCLKVGIRARGHTVITDFFLWFSLVFPVKR
jgi:hypothetical protein